MSGLRIHMSFESRELFRVAALLVRFEGLAPIKPVLERDTGEWQTRIERLSDQKDRLMTLGRMMQVDMPEEELPAGFLLEDASVADVLHAAETSADERIARGKEVDRRLSDIGEWLDNLHFLAEAIAISPEKLGGMHFLVAALGWVPDEAFQKSRTMFRRTPAVIVPLAQNESGWLVWAAALCGHAASMERMIEELRFRGMALPDSLSEGPQDLRRMLRDRYASLALEQQQISIRKRQWSAEWRERLQHLFRRVLTELHIARWVAEYAVPGEYASIVGEIDDSRGEELIQEFRKTAVHPYAVVMSDVIES